MVLKRARVLSINVQKRFNESPPIPHFLKRLQPEPSRNQNLKPKARPASSVDDHPELFTRTLITPQPFSRYHHLWLHKTLTNQSRIKNLPIPTPNHKSVSMMTCIIHHIASNGPSTLDGLWRGLRPLGVIKSRRRLKKTIKKYIEKYPDTLPFVNLNTYQQRVDDHKEEDEGTDDDSSSDSDTESGSGTESEFESESESESESASDSESEFRIDSDFSETDSSLSTDWDSDGMQPAVYGIRPEKKEKIIAKYAKKSEKIEQKIEEGTLDLYNENSNLWWYSIHENGKPTAKGPIMWDELQQRSKTDKTTKGKLNRNKITSKTPVFNFGYMEHWKELQDVVKTMR